MRGRFYRRFHRVLKVNKLGFETAGERLPCGCWDCRGNNPVAGIWDKQTGKQVLGMLLNKLFFV